MCKSQAEGGQRCFSHAMQQVTKAVAAYDEAVGMKTPVGSSEFNKAEQGVHDAYVELAKTPKGAVLFTKLTRPDVTTPTDVLRQYRALEHRMRDSDSYADRVLYEAELMRERDAVLAEPSAHLASYKSLRAKTRAAWATVAVAAPTAMAAGFHAVFLADSWQTPAAAGVALATAGFAWVAGEDLDHWATREKSKVDADALQAREKAYTLSNRAKHLPRDYCKSCKGSQGMEAWDGTWIRCGACHGTGLGKKSMSEAGHSPRRR